MNRKALPPLTVEQVVALAKKCGEIQVNPLKYRKWRGLQACEQAARLGLLRRSRHKLDMLIFYPVTQPQGTCPGGRTHEPIDL